MIGLDEFKKVKDDLSDQGEKTPVLFIGHGSPINGIEDNEFSKRWNDLGKQLSLPAAVLCISAHWYTRGTFLTAMNQPRTIHDFYGFPQELFNVQYPAPGNPGLAQQTANLVKQTNVVLDHEWGLDHGCWSVVRQMYPEANIPVLQLSIDGTKPAAWHYELAKELTVLRSKGVLIIGSGNMVHNLQMVDWKNPEGGYDWAEEANRKFKQQIESGNYAKLQNYSELGTAVKLSIPTPDHYLPLMYVLGLKEKHEEVKFFNDKVVMGSVSMTSIKIE
jgi:4,5-DOPA dioxygenase extradiol